MNCKARNKLTDIFLQFWIFTLGPEIKSHTWNYIHSSIFNICSYIKWIYLMTRFLYWIHTILLVWDTGCVVMNCLDHTQMLLHMLDSTWHALLQNLFGQMRVLSIPVLFLVSQSKYLYGYESEGQNFQNLIFILVIFKQNKSYTNQTVDRGQKRHWRNW